MGKITFDQLQDAFKVQGGEVDSSASFPDDPEWLVEVKVGTMSLPPKRVRAISRAVAENLTRRAIGDAATSVYAKRI